MGERFPVVNGLLNAIRRKKSKVCTGAASGTPPILAPPKLD